MITDRPEEVESRMLWKVNAGQSNFFWDNYSGLGALAKIILRVGRNSKVLVKDFINNGKWDIQKMREKVPGKWDMQKTRDKVPDHNVAEKLAKVDIGESGIHDYIMLYGWTLMMVIILTSLLRIL